MADLDSSFHEYYPPTEEQRRRAVTKGLVCLDTNVILDAYRFAPAARNELLTVLAKLGNRLWIPHQVAREFHRNRIKVIGDQAGAYTDALSALSGLEEYFKENVESKIKDLKRSVALSEAQEKEIIDPFALAISGTMELVSDLKQQHGVNLDMISEDPVLKRLENLFKGRVGESPNPDDEQEDQIEAKRRVAEKIPPGFSDQHKTDSSGDYLVWSQLLREAKRRGLHILFVTRDVKEDWFRREKGRTISARSELIQEAQRVANCDLVIMETRQFLFHARKHLNATVSDELLSQLERLPVVGHASVDSYSNNEQLSTLAATLRSEARSISRQIHEIREEISEKVSDLVEAQETGSGTEEISRIMFDLRELTARKKDIQGRADDISLARKSLARKVLESDEIPSTYSLGIRRRAGIGLRSMVLPELQALAEDLGASGVGRMRKSQLIAVITELAGAPTSSDFND